MKYNTIRRYDVTNGPGVRTTLFVSGCTHNCKECFNLELQDFNHGKDWTEKTHKEFMSYASKNEVKGISILGGEPLQQIMDDSLLNLLKEFKCEMPEKSIWLWTGDIFEEAIKNPKKLDIIKCCDIIVDGPFILEKKNLKLKYRGSENQRVIDVQKTLNEGNTVLLEV